MADDFDPWRAIQVTGNLSGTTPQTPPVKWDDLSGLLGTNAQVQNRPAVTTGPATLPVTGAAPGTVATAAITPFTGKETLVNVGGKNPASIRYNNPGAMWEGKSSRKFGADSYGVLSDGNHIANFPTPVAGAAAQFDLLASPKYANRSIGDLIGEWSGMTGGQANVNAYAAKVANSVGLSPDQKLTPQLLQSPAGIAFAKAQAQMEAGRAYPMTDDQWQQAQQLAFGNQVAQSSQIAQQVQQQTAPKAQLVSLPPVQPPLQASNQPSWADLSSFLTK